VFGLEKKILIIPLIIILALSIFAGFKIMSRHSFETPVKYIYVVPSSHFDLGFNAPQDTVAEWAKKNIDLAIQYCSLYPNFHWTVETIWPLEEWMIRTTNHTEINRLFNLVKEGRISIGACYTGVHSGILGYEEVNRLIYPAKMLRETYGVNLTVAFLNDVPGYSWALPQVFSKSGIRYFVTGTNLRFGGGTAIPRRENPFYWEGPDGSKVLTWISYESYCEGWRVYRLTSDYHTMEDAVISELSRLKKIGYPYDAILVIHSADFVDAKFSENMLRNVRIWNSKHESPKFIVSTPEKFFKHMEENHSGQFSTYRGDWVGGWERVKLYAPYNYARIRYAHDHAPIAEKIWSINWILNQDNYPSDEIDFVYKKMLRYDEHTDPSVGWPKLMTKDQIEWDNLLKFEDAKKCYETTYGLIENGLEKLASMIQTDRAAIIVFNPLSWNRTDIVRVKVDPDLLKSSFNLKDSETSVFIPYQKDLETSTVEFIAENVPSIGYKKYEIVPSLTEPEFNKRIHAEDNMIENDFYKVIVNASDGRIISIFDKEEERELVNTESSFKFNDLIKVPQAETTPYTISTGKVHLESYMGPVSGKIIITRENTPFVKTQIFLYSSLKRIDIVNIVDYDKLDFVPLDKHSEWYYFTFPFNINTQNIEVHVEIANKFITPIKDHLPGGFHWELYSQHCIHMNEEKRYGVTFAHKQSFLSMVGSIRKPLSTYSDFSPSEATLILGAIARADQGETKDQGIANITIEPGAEQLRVYEYSITGNIGGFNAVETAKFGWTFNAPLLAIKVEENRSGYIKSPSLSFFKIDKPNIIIVDIKKAKFGDPNDLILRLQEISGNHTDFKLFSLFNISRAEENNIIEESVDSLLPVDPIRSSIEPYETLTLRVNVANLTTNE